VNNNIVLIDAYQRFTQLGYDPVDAAVRTAAQRLRPVFLTTLTTVVGLMPLILGWGANIFTGELDFRGTSTSEIWAPISFVVASGLGFATILTLIVTPVLLCAPRIMWRQLKWLFTAEWSRKKSTKPLEAAE
jgi:multidrug efflux pump